ncbi:aquaporin-7-like isoform X2 [Anneissia japonica]|uniref:aquaporin-7-like isoform X2 n=1 Tax=Anneissia japonica TaxID=1529436 RepID=UPI0014257A0B|nr:aquaporin-7-like isoform X2 [Anneissia japonica]
MALWYEKYSRKIYSTSCCKWRCSRKFFSEFLGMFAFIFIADGTVATAIFYTPEPTDASSEILYINVGIAFGYTIGLYICRENVGYLNAALTLVFWLLGKMKLNDVIIYLIAQFIGACLAEAFIFGLYRDEIEQSTSNETILIFASSVNDGYFGRAAIDQFLKTVFFTIGVMAVIDEGKNKQENDPLKTIKPSKRFEPLIIGLVLFSVGIALSFFARFYFNPLQDLSGLIFVEFAELSKEKWWGFAQAFCPILGALVGATIYILSIENYHQMTAESRSEGAGSYDPLDQDNPSESLP